MTSAPDADRRRAGARLWSHHRAAPFPDRFRAEEVAGVDLVVVDADIAGCVYTWLHSSGPLDRARLTVLREHLRDLASTLPLLDGPLEREYVGRLRELAALVLAS